MVSRAGAEKLSIILVGFCFTELSEGLTWRPVGPGHCGEVLCALVGGVVEVLVAGRPLPASCCCSSAVSSHRNAAPWSAPWSANSVDFSIFRYSVVRPVVSKFDVMIDIIDIPRSPPWSAHSMLRPILSILRGQQSGTKFQTRLPPI